MSHINRRKFQRIALTDENGSIIERAYALLSLDHETYRRQIQNISYRGVGILIEATDRAWLKEQAQMPLTLELEDTLAKTQGRVTHLGEASAGISFLALDEVSRRIISAYMDPRYLGANLRAIPAEKLGDPHLHAWIGPNNTRLTLWQTPKGGIKALEIHFLTSHLSLDKGGQVRTGELVDVLALTAGAMLSGAEKEIRWHAQADPSTVEGILRMLRYAPIDIESRSLIEQALFVVHRQQQRH